MKYFIKGMGLINLFPSERNIDISIPSQTDAEAFQSDLKAVGKDMYYAIGIIDKELKA
jgi:hypothetical protein